MARVGSLVAQNYRNPNWWWNEIGVPTTLAETCLLLAPEFQSPEQLAQADRNLDSKRWNQLTGQNLVWMTKIRILRGCLLNNEEVVRSGFERLWQEIFIAPIGQEGVQADGSFHQHGNVLYTGGYGQGFATDLAHLAACAEDTPFAIPEARRNILSSYVLDGQQWMVRGRVWDYGVVGREITRPGKDARGLVPGLRELARLSWPRRQEFQAFLTRLEGRPEALPLSGNRHFWRSDFHVHSRPGFLTSVRMHSTRVDNTDSYTNGEGKRNHHIADGVTFLFRTGEEYRDIFPCWDWRKLPGITCAQSDQPFDPAKVRQHGGTSFVGGVSDGISGCAAMDFQRNGLAARKAWFFFDDAFLGLGAGISHAGEEEVTTSLNQCLLQGSVRVSSQENALPQTGARNLDEVRWVWHNEVAYAFPEPQTVVLANEARTGNWKDIGVVNRRENKDIFGLWISHGHKPKNSDYAYAIAPGLAPDAVERWVTTKMPRILVNTPDLQAVKSEGLWQAVFWKPGEVDDGVLRFAVDQPCLITLHRDKDLLRVSASNPENKPLTVNLRISLKLQGDEVRTEGGLSKVVIDLPSDLRAGSSLVKSFSVAD